MTNLLALTHLALPEEYVRFISVHNGGVCRAQVIFLENGDEVLCDCLFGNGLKDSLDIGFWIKELSGALPANCIPIGSDPGGAFYLLLLMESRWTVAYYDHAYLLTSSNDENNTYRCNVSLVELLELIESPFRV